MDEVKEVAGAFVQHAKDDEIVTAFQRGPDGYQVNVQYSEIDFSKTRLVQRRRREASIEFEMQEGRTVIRLPATEKAKQIVEELRERIASKRQAEVAAERIELSAVLEPGPRTLFFTRLIAEVPEFSLSNVTHVRVESSQQERDELDDGDDEDTDLAEQEMLSVVQNVLLKGQSLLGSPVFQELKQRGFYITSITWQARNARDSSEVEFEAGFEEPRGGKGFRYNVRGVRRYDAGKYTKTLRPVDDDQKAYLFSLLEETARKILKELEADTANPEVSGE